MLGSSQLLPMAMARVGQYHEAINWCMQHMSAIRFNLLYDVGTLISEAEGPADVCPPPPLPPPSHSWSKEKHKNVIKLIIC